MGISHIPTTIFFNIAPNFFNSTGYRFFDFTIFKNFVMQIYEQYIHRYPPGYKSTIYFYSDDRSPESNVLPGYVSRLA